MLDFTAINLLTLAIAITFTSSLQAQHAQVNLQRANGRGAAYFVSQGFEGEYGSLRVVEANKSSELKLAPASAAQDETKAGSADATKVQAAGVSLPGWTGYSLRTGFGSEMVKALRLGAFHSLVNSRRGDNEFESLSGSRFSLEGNLVFTNPLANVSLGYGASLANYRYQRDLESARLGGSGSAWSLGAERFFSSSAAISLSARTTRERLQKASGAPSIASRFESESFGIGLGLSLWM